MGNGLTLFGAGSNYWAIHDASTLIPDSGQGYQDIRARDLTLTRNLSVAGSLTTDDARIVLNADDTAALDAMGIVARRNGAADACIFWDETNDRWVLGTTTADTIATTAPANVSLGSIVGIGGFPNATGINGTGGLTLAFYGNSAGGIGGAGAVFVMGTTGGIPRAQMCDTGILQWCNAQIGPSDGTADLGLARTAAGILEVNNGTAGAFGALLAGRSIELNAGATNVAIGEQNRLFTNEGTVARVDYTLPTAVAGYTYTFYCQDADGIRIVAAAGDTIRIAGSVSAAAGRADSSTIGSALTLVAINATEWVAVASVGTWAVT